MILAPKAGMSSFPHPENIARTRRLGEWCPVFLTEYMRLVDVEREFESRSQWALQLLKVVETLSPGTRQSLAGKPFWRKVWRRVTRS